MMFDKIVERSREARRRQRPVVISISGSRPRPNLRLDGNWVEADGSPVFCVILQRELIGQAGHNAKSHASPQGAARVPYPGRFPPPLSFAQTRSRRPGRKTPETPG